MRWEYREDYLDFHTLTIVHKNQSVPIATLTFSYFNFPERNTKERERQRAWRMISPVLLAHINTLGQQGWELTSLFNDSTVDIAEGEHVPTVLFILIGATVIGLPVALLWAYI